MTQPALEGATFAPLDAPKEGGWRKANVVTRERMKAPGAWIGGQRHSFARQQFQLLYAEHGWTRACAWAEEMILWPDARRPEEKHLRDWALQWELGRAQIDPEIRESFTRRMEKMLRSAGIATAMESGRASRNFSRLFAKVTQARLAGEKVDEQDLEVLRTGTAAYAHAGQTTGWVTREVVSPQQQQRGQLTFEGGLTINAGPPPKQPLKQLRSHKERKYAQAPPALEAEYSEVP